MNEESKSRREQQIETNAKYYSQDLGKEKMPRIGIINLASLFLDEIKKLDQ